MYLIVKNSRAVVSRHTDRSVVVAEAKKLSTKHPGATYAVAKEMRRYWQDKTPASRTPREEEV